MAKQKKSKNKKNRKLGINKIMYYALIPILMVYAKLRYNIKIKRSALKGKKGPFLVLGNHTAPIDFIFFSGILFPRKLNYVVAQNMYYHKTYGAVIKKFNCISKCQFTPDFICIKKIKKFLDNGTSVLMFPEGRVTVDGTTSYISPSIGKLIKWLKYPVVCGITRGGYVSNPKWGGKRKCKVSLSLKQILSVEDIKQMDLSQINKKIKENLVYNDNTALIESGKKLKGKNLAEGLEKVLYKCPNCYAEFENYTDDNKLICKKCNNTVVYNKNGLITPNDEKSISFKRIDLWFKFQRNIIEREIKNKDFEMNDKADVFVNDITSHRFILKGQGNLTLTHAGLEFNGTIDGINKNLKFESKNMPTIAYKIGDSVDIYDKNIYRFVFKNRKCSTKYCLAIEELYRRLSES